MNGAMNAPASDRAKHLTRQRIALGGGLPSRLLAPSMHRVLDRLDAGLVEGGIEATLPDGACRILGCRAPGPVAQVDLRDWRALLRLMAGGSAGWYRAWELGEWTSPDPVPLFDLFMRNRVSLGQAARSRGPWKLLGKLRHCLRDNSPAKARRNIEYHYDLGNDFYELWLDETMSYSSALFAEAKADDDRETLAGAQRRKIDAVLERLDLRDGARLLEIGCGWGGLAERACGRFAIDYRGITLSAQQKTAAEARTSESGANCGASGAAGSTMVFSLTDYRDVLAVEGPASFDAIASVEMVEAVGQRYWPAYLDSIAANLKPGGRAGLQYICIADDIFEHYAASADFIQTYIFPGGMLLSEGRFRALAKERGLAWADQRNMGADYARTLKLWRRRFDAAVEAGRLPAGFDARFVRLWRYYLQYCEGGFRGGGIDVAQVTLIKE